MRPVKVQSPNNHCFNYNVPLSCSMQFLIRMIHVTKLYIIIYLHLWGIHNALLHTFPGMHLWMEPKQFCAMNQNEKLISKNENLKARCQYLLSKKVEWLAEKTGFSNLFVSSYHTLLFQRNMCFTVVYIVLMYLLYSYHKYQFGLQNVCITFLKLCRDSWYDRAAFPVPCWVWLQYTHSCSLHGSDFFSSSLI